MKESPLILLVICVAILCLQMITSVGRFRDVFRMDADSRKALHYMSLGFFAVSTCFTIMSIFLMYFMQENGNVVVCESAIFTCITLYTSSKVLLYVFLIEKAHNLHKAKRDMSRKESLLYRVSICVLSPFVIIIALMFVYRVADIDRAENCRIGVQRESSLPLLCYDTLFSMYSVTLFLYPLYNNWSNHNANIIFYVARKNFIGSLLSMIATSTNLFIVYSRRGRQLGYECLFFCIMDVFLNVMIVDWLVAKRKVYVANSSFTGLEAADGSLNDYNDKESNTATANWGVYVQDIPLFNQHHNSLNSSVGSEIEKLRPEDMQKFSFRQQYLEERGTFNPNYPGRPVLLRPDTAQETTMQDTLGEVAQGTLL